MCVPQHYAHVSQEKRLPNVLQDSPEYCELRRNTGSLSDFEKQIVQKETQAPNKGGVHRGNKIWDAIKTRTQKRKKLRRSVVDDNAAKRNITL